MKKISLELIYGMNLGLETNEETWNLSSCSWSFGHGGKKTSILESSGFGIRIGWSQIGKEEPVSLVMVVGLEQRQIELKRDIHVCIYNSIGKYMLNSIVLLLCQNRGYIVLVHAYIIPQEEFKF